MKIKETLFPGENGTRELAQEYGDRLVCVRYRHDQIRHKWLRTVEIIVDESDWPVKTPLKNDSQVFVRLESNENDIREQIEAVGGTWSPAENAWQMNYRKALQIGLEKWIIY